MGLTIAEKILMRASGKNDIKAGEYVTANVDLALIVEGSKVYKILENAKIAKIWDTSKVISIMDHAVPPPSIAFAEEYKFIRQAVKKFGIKKAYGENLGISHQVLVEKGDILPGMLILGDDSHCTTYGAIGAAGTGVDYTEMAYILNTGYTYLQVPETIKFNIIGTLRKNVMAKDVMLYIAGKYSAEIAQYKAIEFTGYGVQEFSIDSRMSMSNLGVEIGAKFAFFEVDEKTLKFLKKIVNLPLNPLKSDPDAIYKQIIDVDISTLEPQVALPHRVDNVKPISKIREIKIDQIFLGSCTNGRLEDLEIAATILKDKKIHPNIRMIIIPASWEIYSKAMHRGFIDVFIKSGAIIGPPGCGPCVGNHLGILGAGERCLGTQNRNFKGRMGSYDAEIYLCSPATAAASAIEGKITDPRNYL